MPIFYQPPREKLYAARTYYVRTDGSDTAADGMANLAYGVSSSAAFLTVQKAIDTIWQDLDLNNNDVTIQVGDGTYTANITASGSLTGRGTVTLQGNVATPANVLLTSASGITITVTKFAALNIASFKVTAGSGGQGIQYTNNAFGNGTGIDFGAIAGAGFHISANANAFFQFTGPYTISGGTGTHMRAQNNGFVGTNSASIPTLTGTPAFSSSFLLASQGGILFWNAAPVGAATGKKFIISGGGRIAFITYIVPGDSVGTGYREVLSAVRTYFVRTDGSDSNDGLLNSAARAFLTVQKAIDTVINTLDCGGFAVTISVADGTYSGSTIVSMTQPVLNGTLSIVGNTGTPGNVIFSATGVAVFVDGGALLTISGVKITTSGLYCLHALQGGRILHSSMQFGAAGAAGGAHMRAALRGYINATGNYEINGDAAYHYLVQDNGFIGVAAGLTVSITGARTVTQFALVETCGVLKAITITYTIAVSVTGTRYLVDLNGVIFTNAGGATYLPGSIGGSTATGGQYA